LSLGYKIDVEYFFTQVLIRGSHTIESRLSIDVDVQILTNPSIDAGQSSKARYQVLSVNDVMDIMKLKGQGLPFQRKGELF